MDLVPGNSHSISDLPCLLNIEPSKSLTVKDPVFPPSLESSPTLLGSLHMFMSKKPRVKRSNDDVPITEASLPLFLVKSTNHHSGPIRSELGQDTSNLHTVPYAERGSRPAVGGKGTLYSLWRGKTHARLPGKIQ